MRRLLLLLVMVSLLAGCGGSTGSTFTGTTSTTESTAPAAPANLSSLAVTIEGVNARTLARLESSVVSFRLKAYLHGVLVGQVTVTRGLTAPNQVVTLPNLAAGSYVVDLEALDGTGQTLSYFRFPVVPVPSVSGVQTSASGLIPGSPPPVPGASPPATPTPTPTGPPNPGATPTPATSPTPASTPTPGTTPTPSSTPTPATTPTPTSTPTPTANGEFRVNSVASGQQRDVAVARDASGNFVVVWALYPVSTESGRLLAQRYRADGQKLGDEIQVNRTPGLHRFPSVAMDDAGDFVVVWTRSQTVVMRRFDKDGLGLDGSDVSVSQGLTPRVARDADSGEFAVVWQDFSLDPSSAISRAAVFCRVYRADGTLLRGTATVSPASATNPWVAMDSSSRVVVAYQAVPTSPPSQVFFRSYAADGTPSAAQAVTPPGVEGNGARCACNPATGEFAVCYQLNPPFLVGFRRFGADGSTRGTETLLPGSLASGGLGLDAGGELSLSWRAGSVEVPVFVYQRFNFDTGAALDAQPQQANTLPLNEGLSGDLTLAVNPSAANLGNRNLILAWRRGSRSLGESDILGRIVAPLPPRLRALVISPPDTTIVVGNTVQYQAEGLFSDGSRQDLTAAVTWASLNTAAATIEAGGLATGRDLGATNVTARLGDVFSAVPATLRVLLPSSNPPAPVPTPTPAAGTPLFVGGNGSLAPQQVIYSESVSSTGALTLVNSTAAPGRVHDLFRIGNSLYAALAFGQPGSFLGIQQYSVSGAALTPVNYFQDGAAPDTGGQAVRMSSNGTNALHAVVGFNGNVFTFRLNGAGAPTSQTVTAATGATNLVDVLFLGPDFVLALDSTKNLHVFQDNGVVLTEVDQDAGTGGVQPFAVGGPGTQGLRLTATGGRVYVSTNGPGPDQIRRLDFTGGLLSNDSAAFAYAGTQGPRDMHVVGGNLYVAQVNPTGVQAFSVGGTGDLTPVGALLATPAPPSNFVDLTVGGTTFLYTNVNAGPIGYTIGGGGALTVVPGSPFPGLTNPFSLAR